MVLTGNSMGSSEIWDKYHECCIGNGKFHLASPREIYPHFQYNTRGIYPKFHCYPCYYQLKNLCTAQLYVKPMSRFTDYSGLTPLAKLNVDVLLLHVIA